MCRLDPRVLNLTRAAPPPNSPPWPPRFRCPVSIVPLSHALPPPRGTRVRKGHRGHGAAPGDLRDRACRAKVVWVSRRSVDSPELACYVGRAVSCSSALRLCRSVWRSRERGRGKVLLPCSQPRGPVPHWCCRGNSGPVARDDLTGPGGVTRLPALELSWIVGDGVVALSHRASTSSTGP